MRESPLPYFSIRLVKYQASVISFVVRIGLVGILHQLFNCEIAIKLLGNCYLINVTRFIPVFSVNLFSVTAGTLLRAYYCFNFVGRNDFFRINVKVLRPHGVIFSRPFMKFVSADPTLHTTHRCSKFSGQLSER